MSAAPRRRRWRKKQVQLGLRAAEQLPLAVDVSASAIPALERGRIREAGGWVKTGNGTAGYVVRIAGERALVRFAGLPPGFPFPRQVWLELAVLAPARRPQPGGPGVLRQDPESREGDA